MNTSKIARYGMLIAVAFVLSYLETFLTIPIAVPGVKLGLANLAVLTALYRLGPGAAFVMSVIRVLLSALTFRGMSVLIYSMAGCLLSFLCMVLVKKSNLFGVTGVSIVGGVMHNIGQLIAAAIVLRTGAIISYAPVLLVAGSVFGIIIGILGEQLIKRLPGDVMK